MVRLIVTDYDGTLVPAGHELSSRFYTKLHTMALRGVIFAVASGRPYNQLKKLLYPIAQDAVFISDDGAQMMYHNCVLYKKPIETAKAKAMAAFALAEGMTPIVALREENRSVTPEKLALPFFFSSDVFKLILVKNGKDTASAVAKAKEMGLRVCFEDETYLELCHESANKGEALKVLMQKFSVPGTQTVVCGDGENDLPMLALGGRRVVPEQADPAVRSMATDMVPSVEDFLIEM